MDPIIKNYFYPKSVCIVGASSKEKSIGYEILHTISNYGYKGIIYPVNPKTDSILGYKCYKTIEEISDPIDLAIIVLPKKFVEDAVDVLLSKGVRSLLLITAGFKETGKEGEELEKRLVERIKASGARLVGPNCMGVINTLDNVKLNATFVAEKPESGHTGFFSQSGALGAAVLNSLRETEIKFAHFISAGNKADINENDLLFFWQADSNVKTITYYLESFVNGKEFIKPFMTGEITKPTIILKAGKTVSGQKAASSHTGALGSENKVVNSILKQFGIINVNTVNDLFNTAKGFENFPIPKGKNVAVVTNAGGPAILTVDSLEVEGLELAKFSRETKHKLREIVSPEGSVENPIDLLPAATAEIYKSVIEIVIDDPNVDSVISIFVQPVMVEPLGVVEAVNNIESEKPILQVDMPLPEFWDEYHRYSKKHLPIYRSPEDPAKVICNMLFYNKYKKKLERDRETYLQLLNLKQRNKITSSSGFLSPPAINELAAAYKLPFIQSKIIPKASLEKVTDLTFPVVLKGLSKSVIHKSELNAVKLNIKSFDELIERSKEIINNFKLNNLEVEGFLIQPFVSQKYEILIGGFRDRSFGPVLMFGSGGKYVEVLDDTSTKSAYLSDSDIDDMINSTKVGKILSGVRGETPVDLSNLKKLLRSAAQMLIENEEIIEFDFNPVIISQDNSIHIVDVRIKVT